MRGSCYQPYDTTVNAIFERYSFNTRNQQEHESFKVYYSALRGQVEKYEYGEFRGELLRDRIVGGIRSDSVRKVLLSKKDLTLSSAVDICLKSETSMHQASTMAAGSLTTTPSVSESESIFALHRQRTPQCTNSSEQQPQGGQTKLCQYCGQNHKRGRRVCPANGQRYL